MQIRHNRDGVFEKLYPKTLSGNVMMNDGNTLEQWKVEVNDRLNEEEVEDDENLLLWQGANVMDSDTSITVNKPLSQCRNGWILVFAKERETPSSYRNNYGYKFVPKVHLISATEGPEWIKFILGNSRSRVVSKYLRIRDTTIEGHAVNIDPENGAEEIILINVFEY